jgi:copper oxidase (laccase) domain-containing protein
MEDLGASRASITAVLGPAIAQESYEVGTEFFTRFCDADRDFARFFLPGDRQGYFWFDLPAFIGLQLQKAGIAHFENLGLDTYADEERFFSYRRSVHRKEQDYGRQIAAIALV